MTGYKWNSEILFQIVSDPIIIKIQPVISALEWVLHQAMWNTVLNSCPDLHQEGTHAWAWENTQPTRYSKMSWYWPTVFWTCTVASISTYVTNWKVKRNGRIKKINKLRGKLLWVRLGKGREEQLLHMWYHVIITENSRSYWNVLSDNIRRVNHATKYKKNWKK